MEDISRPRQLKYGSQYRYRDGRSEEPFYENSISPSAGTTEKRRTLPRTISAADIRLASQCESIVERDYVPEPPKGGTTFFANVPAFTLTLPVIENVAFQEYVLDILRDSAVNRTLEGDHVINWCDSLPTLTPLNTIRDGNCLLHAASMGMWGFQDRKLFLRHALNRALECRAQNFNTFFSRWKYVQERENQHYGMTMDPQAWDREWQEVKSQSSTDVVVGKNLDSLSEFHVFVLANVLRRPIIMYASPKYRSLASGGTLQKLNFSGIYLPLLWDPSVCKRSPLPLAYSNFHFSALLMMESPDQYNRGQLMLPLMERDGTSMPIRFCLDVESPNVLVREYLDLTEVRASPFPVPCCKLTTPEPKSNNFTYSLVRSFLRCCEESFVQGGRGVHTREPRGERLCKNSCGRFSEGNLSGYCSVCFQQSQDFDNSPQERRSSPQDFGNPRIGDQPQARPRQPSVQSGGGRGTVKCSECSEPGLPQYLGRCKRCHNRIQSNNAEDIYEPLPSPPTVKRSSNGGSDSNPPSVPLPRNRSERSKCRTPGCDFFGTKETRFYCSQCFDSNLDNIVKEVEESPSLPPPSPVPSPNVFESRGAGQQEMSGSDSPTCPSCREFFGSSELNGLCNKCFLKSTEVPADKQRRDSSAQSRSKDVKREEVLPRGRDAADDSPIYSKPRSRLSGEQDRESVSIYKVTSQMGSVNIRAECVVCNEDRNIDSTDSEAFVLCRKHAKQLLGNGQGQQERDARQKRMSATMHHGDSSPQYGSRIRDSNVGYTQPIQGRMHSGYGGNHFDDPYQPIRKSSGSFDSRGLPPPMDTEYSAHVKQNNAKPDYDSSPNFHQRGEGHFRGADRGSIHRGGRDAIGMSDTFERDRYQQGDGGGGGGRGGFRGREWEEQPPRGNVMDRERFGSSAAADWNNGGRGVGAGGRIEDRFDGSKAGGFDGDRRIRADSGRGGAGGGAGGYNRPVAGAVGGTAGKLCQIPGCSYYSYRDLENYCPDCFEETFKKQVNRDVYPQI